MPAELQIVLWMAITVSCIHTISGPDHYLPFIALSRVRGWSLRTTIFWTLVCGSGHVLGSVVLGILGALIGWSLTSLSWFQSIRGGLAGWALLLFGLGYLLYGWIQLKKDNSHRHFDVNEGDSVYVYQHRHGQGVLPSERHKLTPWVLFLVFVLGPCEPMIPLLYLPAVKNLWYGMPLLVFVYLFFTLVTMVLVVMLGYYGIVLRKAAFLEKYIHLIGGFSILACGAGMVFFDW